MNARRLLLAIVLAGPAAWWIAKACLDPSVEMLPPGGGWVVDPRWSVEWNGDTFPATVFRLELDLAETPATAPIAIASLGHFQLALNGTPLFDSGTMRRHWRRPVRIDIAPALVHGHNELWLRARNERGPTPVRVEGRVAGAELATGAARWVASVRDEPWTPAVGALAGEHQLRGKRWPGALWPMLALATAAAALALLGLARPRRAPPPAAAGRWLVWLALALAIAPYLWNGLQFPYRRSRLDWGGHVEHLRDAAVTWRPALATEGWQMYQPPLYYWLAGRLYLALGGDLDREPALRAVQLAGGVIGAAHVVLLLGLLVRFGPASHLARASALLLIGAMPMALTTSPMITNEPFAGLCGGLAIAAVLGLVAAPHPGVARAVLAGVALAAALLAKFSGLMPLLAAIVALAGRAFAHPAERRRTLAVGLLAIGLAVVLAGPYYARNVIVFGKPFVGNWDPIVRLYEDDPGYRSFAFFTRAGSLLTHFPEYARWWSVWDALYGSAWGEIHDNWLAPYDRPRIARARLVYGLALLPSIALGAGIVRSLRRIWRGSDQHPADLLLVAVSWFALVAVLVFVMVVPFFSTPKGFFLLQLLGPLALWTAHGFARIEAGLGARGRWLVALAALAQTALVLDLYAWPP